MNLQYISDSNGTPTGVFIPLKDWKKLKEKYGDLDTEFVDIPQWHKKELDNRLKDYLNNPEQVLDFNEAINDIEREF